MDYFVTDHEGKDWLGRQWAEGRGHREANDNYYFITYPDPLLALLMNPIYDGYEKPRLWESVGVGQVPGNDFRKAWKELAVIREVGVAPPSIEQAVTFGLVCALSTVSNTSFVRWALAWLSGDDRTQETAVKMSAKLLDLIMVDDVSGAHAAVHAVAGDDPRQYAACAAHRAWNSPTGPLDLVQMALVVMTLTPEEIGKMLGGDDGTSQPAAADGPATPPVCDPPGTDEREGPTDDHHDGTADVGHGRVLPGSEGGNPDGPQLG